jgi:hypothetical protein
MWVIKILLFVRHKLFMFGTLEVKVSWLPVEAPELEVIDAKGVLKLT